MVPTDTFNLSGSWRGSRGRSIGVGAYIKLTIVRELAGRLFRSGVTSLGVLAGAMALATAALALFVAAPAQAAGGFGGEPVSGASGPGASLVPDGATGAVVPTGAAQAAATVQAATRPATVPAEVTHAVSDALAAARAPRTVAGAASPTPPVTIASGPGAAAEATAPAQSAPKRSASTVANVPSPPPPPPVRADVAASLPPSHVHVGPVVTPTGPSFAPSRLLPRLSSLESLLPPIVSSSELRLVLPLLHLPSDPTATGPELPPPPSPTGATSGPPTLPGLGATAGLPEYQIPLGIAAAQSSLSAAADVISSAFPSMPAVGGLTALANVTSSAEVQALGQLVVSMDTNPALRSPVPWLAAHSFGAKPPVHPASAATVGLSDPAGLALSVAGAQVAGRAASAPSYARPRVARPAPDHDSAPARPAAPTPPPALAGGSSAGSGVGIGTGAGAVVLFAVLSLWLSQFAPGRVSMELKGWRSTLLTLRLERPG
jgi:pilus assembly protein FimV